MSDPRTKSMEVLEGIVAREGFLGASVATRDGLPGLSHFTRPVSEETLSAMTAALLGAAEAALQEWSEERPNRATIESRSLRMWAIGLDSEYFFIAVAPTTLDFAKAAKAVDGAAERLKSALKG